MKEFPQPSAQLEDRIMQAVYQLSGPHAIPPVTAAAETILPPPASKQVPWRLQQWGWAGAAAAVLAIGLISMQMMNGKQLDMAAIQAPASSSEQAEVATTTTAPGSNPESSAPSIASNHSGQPAGAAEPVIKQSDSGQVIAQITPGETAPSTTSPAASQSPEIATKQEQPASTAAISQPPAVLSAPTGTADHMLAARSKQSNAAAKEAPAAAEQQPTFQGPAPVTGEEHALADQVEQAKTGSIASIAGIAAEPNAPTSVAEAPEAGAQEAQITLSTFTDVETASHASDVSIPSVAKLPEGFSLSSVSLRYESETSKKVSNVSIMYHRNSDPIKIEVTRQSAGEHSLSVPGTFTETQVFQIGTERAIGVTYQGTSEHAVHFYTTKGDDTLYVVLTANGISLQELIQLAKELTWTAK
ncbi:hypothetical protein [Brevibacillus migulae]|uniref:hypothetical protein n=1 Tax=Brevibacillus migulae TaxID=1644114 RepID=UPI00106E6783|nr:hypothetical protein [Brevibacillus migulae]